MTNVHFSGGALAYTPPVRLFFVATFFSFTLGAINDLFNKGPAVVEGPQPVEIAQKKAIIQQYPMETYSDSLLDSLWLNLKISSTGDILLSNADLYREAIDSLGVEGFLEQTGSRENTGALTNRILRRSLEKWKNNEWEQLKTNFQATLSLRLLLSLPVYALILQLFFFRQPFSRHFVFCLHFLSFFFLFTGICWFILNLLISILPVNIAVFGFSLVVVYFYLMLAIRRVYHRRWWRSIVVAFLVAILFLAILLIFSVVFGLLYILFF